MQRVSVGFHQSSPAEETKYNQRFQSLVQDFLELQKEYVSMKKKLQIAQQQRNTLADEVSFLRQRHKYLLKLQSPEAEPELGAFQNADIDPEPIRKEKDCPTSVLKTKHGLGDIEQEGRIKKLKMSLVNDKQVGKKKISWQDQVDLKV
ncbi:Ribosomal RNA small subunit methyltransferase G [Quillaja saponaria]|uniref:Ribosomal RNA small subunit methyltransferase G n=1 Tax=Quillaja saponaria TaxID=32244 RepID=A0AAD7LXS8_QUISA|nr:Ribosomal RNA small subunit methyltransferase G [Quillaja saponaria]